MNTPIHNTFLVSVTTLIGNKDIITRIKEQFSLAVSWIVLCMNTYECHIQCHLRKTLPKSIKMFITISPLSKNPDMLR